ncbi:MAG TPA: hypothetical protein DCO79_01195 [Spirochaeta sp.]|nr:hypothetical protein [Spirochaeta sp.]
MKILKITAIIISAVAAILLLTLLFFVITEYRPEQNTVLSPVYGSEAENAAPGGMRILSWNIGYCGLDSQMDFFMEGGTSTAPSPLKNQRESLDEVIAFIDRQEADICMIQEIESGSKRSFRVDQVYTASSALKNYEIYYALNFKSPFVPVPVKAPIGKVESGIALMSRFSVDAAERRQLPGSFSWPVKIFHLKRCALISSIPSPVEGKNWYIINVHLTAYGDGGMRQLQLDYLKKLITDLYSEGHYVVVGGDWNSMFPGTGKDAFGDYTTAEEHLFWLQSIPDGWTPENWQWCYDSEVPTSRTLEQPYKAGENFTCIIDGFLVSPNLRVDEVEAYNLRFEHSDHNPTAITVSIRE